MSLPNRKGHEEVSNVRDFYPACILCPVLWSGVVT
jgi:hypothetical protein